MRTPMERAAAFSALLVAVYASPLVLTSSTDAWEFIHQWDDKENFVTNAVIQAPLTAESLRVMWTTGRINVYEPLSWMLKAVVYQLVGLNAWWVRVVTLVLHVTACAVLSRASVMLLELLDLLGTKTSAGNAQPDDRQWTAVCLISGAMFAVHPVHVQVVAWPSGQPYALAGLFANLAIYAYLRPIHKSLARADHKADRSRSRRPGQHVGLCSERDQVLSIVAGEADTWGRAFVVTGLYGCAVLSKSASIFTPAAFVLIDLLLLLKASTVTSTSTHKPSSAIGATRAPTQVLPSSRLQRLFPYAVRKLPIAIVFTAFALVTILFNRHGAHQDADALVMTMNERTVKALGTPVDVVRLVLWPAKLRPHYQQLEAQYADMWRADNLLPIVTLGLVMWAALYRCHPSINTPQHAFALAYFGLTLLPVCGLIQHGIVAGASDRYAYLGSITLVPYGGAVLSRWLFPGSCNRFGAEGNADIDDREYPESTTAQATLAARHGIQITPIPAARARNGGLHRWVLIVLPASTLLCISTQLMNSWRTEETLLNYELQVDPFDWRELDTLATMLNQRGDCKHNWEVCRPLFERSFINAPTSSVKAKLFRLRTYIALGGNSVVPEACKAYEQLAIDHPDQPLVLNNLGVCRCRDKRYTEAREMFVQALAHAQTDAHRKSISDNIAAYDEWDRQRPASGADGAVDQGFETRILY